jgi:DNA-binding Xre family transcriptional regulator
MGEARNQRVYTSRGPADGEDWDAVATAVNDRMAARRIGQQELSTLSGVSVSTLRQVQHGAGRRIQNKTLAAISRALDWPDDHLAGVLLARRHTTGDDTPPAAVGVAEALRQLDHRLAEISDRLAAIEAGIERASRGGRRS